MQLAKRIHETKGNVLRIEASKITFFFKRQLDPGVFAEGEPVWEEEEVENKKRLIMADDQVNAFLRMAACPFPYLSSTPQEALCWLPQTILGVLSGDRTVTLRSLPFHKGTPLMTADQPDGPPGSWQDFIPKGLFHSISFLAPPCGAWLRAECRPLEKAGNAQRTTESSSHSFYLASLPAWGHILPSKKPTLIVPSPSMSMHTEASG